MAYKKTTYTNKNTGTRRTYTTSVKGPKRSSSISTSQKNGKNSRVTTTTNLNTGVTKRYVTTNFGGWIERKSLDGKKTKIPKPKKPRTSRYRKAKPIKFTTWLWILFTLYLISVISK